MRRMQFMNGIDWQFAVTGLYALSHQTSNDYSVRPLEAGSIKVVAPPFEVVEA